MTDNLIKLCGRYENTSKTTGQTYFVGYLGVAKVLLLRDKRAGDGEPGWALMIAERPEKKPEDRAPAGNGRRDGAGQRQVAAVAGPSNQRCRPTGTATERARAARAAGDLPFDDDLPADMQG